MSDELDIEAIEARLNAATPGPWQWYGNTNVHRLYLATVHSGQRFVMQFARWGMSSAQPRFQVDRVMVDGKTLVRYQKDYRKDVEGVNHPDAELIAHAPEDLCALLAEVRRLTDANQRLTDLVRYARGLLHEDGLLTDKEYRDFAENPGAVAR